MSSHLPFIGSEQYNQNQLDRFLLFFLLFVILDVVVICVDNTWRCFRFGLWEQDGTLCI